MGPFGYMHSHLTISLIFFLNNFFLKMMLFHVVSTYKTYGGDTLHQYLLHFFNKILDTGKVPQRLNIVKCVLIHKSGDNLDMLNYRPIAIPSSLLRPLTMRMNTDMSRIVEQEGILGVYFIYNICIYRY